MDTQFISAVPENEIGSSAINMMRSFGVAPIIVKKGAVLVFTILNMVLQNVRESYI
jgi:hypothetical protein